MRVIRVRHKAIEEQPRQKGKVSPLIGELRLNSNAKKNPPESVKSCRRHFFLFFFHVGVEKKMRRGFLKREIIELAKRNMLCLR